MANRERALDREAFSIRDIREKGSAKLPQMYEEYFNQGAMDLLTLRDNEEAFNRYKIRPRILRNVANIDTSVTVCGIKSTFPFAFSPAAMHKVAHPDGEVGTSKAAAAMGIPMGLSAFATCPLEDVIAVGKGNLYFMQLNFMKNRQVMRDIMSRAEAAGYHAILLTVDAPIYSTRLNEARNNLALPSDMQYPNIAPGVDLSDLAVENSPMDFEAGVEWEEAIQFMRAHTKLPIWIKGVYTPEDVSLAIYHGFDGVMISNHGGRQLDSVPSTLDALRDCAPIARGKIPLAIDGGIYRGTDIFKALALGATLCFSGRVPIWGLAYNGTNGVELAINLIYREFKQAMGLAGCAKISDITPAHLSVLDSRGVLSRL